MSNLQSGADKAQTIELLNSIKMPVLGAGGGFAPIGTVNAYMGTTAPQGWLVCNGQTVNIADYPELATHFASHFGSANFFGGDGTTTIAVPDLRGEFLRGSGTNSHTNQGSGANVGVHQDATESPTVFINDANRLYFGKKDTARTPVNADSVIGFSTDNTGRSIYNATSTDTFIDVDPWGMTSGNTNYASRPTNTSVTYIIKATVSGDANAIDWFDGEEHIIGTKDGQYLYAKKISYTNQSSTGSVELAVPMQNIKIWSFCFEHFTVSGATGYGYTNPTFSSNGSIGQYGMMRNYFTDSIISFIIGTSRSGWNYEGVMIYTKTS